MTEQNVISISDLLREVAQAHHAYQEREFGGEHQHDWPRWYSKELLGRGINNYLDRALGMDELIDLLYALDAQYQQNQPAERWYYYYAEKIYHAKK
jgi:hypothetical protein